MQAGTIGLGTMGGGMSRNLVAYDVRDDALDAVVEAGATVAVSPSDLARQSTVVVLSLPGPAVAESVILRPNGIGRLMLPRSVLVDTTSSRRETVERLESPMDRRGAAFGGAPVGGGTAGARDGTVTVSAGGPIQAVRACGPVFDVIGSTDVRIGTDPGDTFETKLLNDVLSFCRLLLNWVKQLREDYGIPPLPC